MIKSLKNGVLVLLLICFCSSFVSCAMMIVQDITYDISNVEKNNPAYNDGTRSEFYSILYDIYYKKHADESFYYSLTVPENGDEDYSGKSYEEIVKKQFGNSSDAILNIEGINQADYEQPIKDIDNLEKDLTLNYTTLQELDKYLNGFNDKKNGVSYVNQFLKPVYTNCDLTDKETDLSTCTLQDLTKKNLVGLTEIIPESTKYSKELLGDYKLTEEKENSLADWGLGSLVHYKAFLEPSKITNYHIENMQVLNENFTYDNGEKPIKTLASSEVTEDLINKYSIEADNYVVPPGGQKYPGYYKVDNQIVYKDWSAVDAASNGGTNGDHYLNNKELWRKGAPGVSTGIPETKVSFAIDKAVTMYGDFDINVEQSWRNVGDTYGTQYTYSSKRFDNKLYSALPFNKHFGDSNLRELHSADGTLYGYIDSKSEPELIPAEYKKKTVVNSYKEETVYYCCINNKCEENPRIQKPTVYDCKIALNSLTDSTAPTIKEEKRKATNIVQHNQILQKDLYGKKYYGCSQVGCEVEIMDSNNLIKPAKLKYTLVLDKNKKSTTNTVEIDLQGNYRYIKDKKDLSENAIKSTIYYNPFYIFKLVAQTKGDLQVNSAFHSALSLMDDEKDALKYLKDYMLNYVAYYPKEEVGFECGDELVPDYTVCENQEALVYAEKPNVSTFSPKLSFKYLTKAQKQKISEYLKYDNIDFDKTEKIMDQKFIFGGTELKLNFNSTEEKIVTTEAERYGVQPDLLKTVLLINDKKVVPGTYKGFDYSDGRKGGDVEVSISNTNTLKEKAVGTAILLQDLAKEYKGNLPMMLTVYDLAFHKESYDEAKEEFSKMLKKYEETTKKSSEAAIEDIHDITWYHYMHDLPAYSDGLCGNHTAQYLKGEVVRSSIPGKGTITWSKLNMKDDVKVDELDMKLMSNFWIFKNSNNKETFWKNLTYGIENLEAGRYIKDGAVDVKPEATVFGKAEKNFNKSEINTILTTVLTKQLNTNWNYLNSQINAGSSDFILNKIGNLNININVSDLFGTSPVLNEIVENKTREEENQNGNYVYNCEKDQEVKAPFSGEVTLSEGQTVIIENNDTKGSRWTKARIIIRGLKPEAELGPISQGVKIGTSLERMTIELEVYDKEDRLSRISYKRIYTSYLEGLYSAYLNYLSQYTNLGDLLPTIIKHGAIWNEIYDLAHNQLGWNGPNGQCTTFTNYRLAQMYLNQGIKINPAQGNGKDVAKGAVSSNPDVFVLQKGGIPKSNSVISWNPGDQYGHTGFVDYVDVENDLIVTSEGNVPIPGIPFDPMADASNHGTYHYRINKLSEWVAKNPNIQYAVPINDPPPVAQGALDRVQEYLKHAGLPDKNPKTNGTQKN